MDKRIPFPLKSGLWFRLALVAALSAAGAPATVLAQAPVAAAATAQAFTPEELEGLVARIALYPDDLVAVILPASTNPLQIVQADRFLEGRKANPKLAIDDQWDDSVKTLVNYPEVVKSMSTDLNWTSDLGEAVVANSGAVLEAVQAFRRKAQSTGNLKSDSRQVVVVEKEVITIAPADPQVIYVPQYNPSTVVVAGSPYWGYYPAPYPSYYYPYAPGAALATGLIWGAAIGAAWNGGRYGANYGGGNNTINIDRNTNVNTGNIGSGNRGGGNTATQWKSNKQPGQVSSGVGAGSRQARTGDAGRGASAGGGSFGGSGGSFGGGGGARASQGGGAGGGSAFQGSNSSGRQTQMDSSRGASSRQASGPSSMSSRQSAGGGAASRPSSGGGGARMSSGGGGARGGGGGRGGGGRR